MRQAGVLWVNAEIYTPGERIVDGRMLIGSDGRIEAVGGSELAAEAGVAVKDAGGCRMLPGFIDVHVHGGGGFDAMESRAALLGVSRYHAAYGTTAFLATTATDRADRIEAALADWRSAASEGAPGLQGADLIGIHLEGPFLNARRGGAQNPEFLRMPDTYEMQRYLDAAGGWMRLVTLAPELPDAERLISMLRERDIVVSAGHTDASYDEIRSASALGVSHMTHHYNGMSPMTQRAPGATGAGLLLSELTIELIVDGHHIHPSMVAMAYALKPADRIVLITDAVICAGCPDGLYEMDGMRIRMEDGKVMLEDGSSLAGSGLNMLQALRNAMAFTGLPIERILPSLTVHPARVAGVSHRKGSLVPGMDADFVMIDSDWNVLRTCVRGKEVYVKDGQNHDL